MKHVLLLLPLIIATGGCSARADYTRVPPGTVTEFSLGSAKVKPFTKHPTAKELHSRLLDLYGSFRSFSYTVKKNDRCVDEYSEENGKAVDPVIKESKYTLEYRWCKPNNLFIMGTGDGSYVSVSDDSTLLWYYPEDNTYTKITDVEPPQKRGHSMLSELLRIVSRKYMPLDTVRLLPDTKINNEEVYVLELLYDGISDDGKKWARMTIRLYVGKRDLLPRKHEDVTHSLDSKALGLPPNSDTSVFSGFTANVELPKDLFILNIPAGAKPADRYKVE